MLLIGGPGDVNKLYESLKAMGYTNIMYPVMKWLFISDILTKLYQLFIYIICIWCKLY